MLSDPFHWSIVLENGKIFSELDKCNFSQVLHHYHLGKLKYLVVNNTTGPLVMVKLGGKRKPIFFRRRMNHLSPLGNFMWTLTGVGWEELINGTSIKSILYIYPNGKLELNNDEPTMATAYHNELISQLQESNP